MVSQRLKTKLAFNDFRQLCNEDALKLFFNKIFGIYEAVVTDTTNYPQTIEVRIPKKNDIKKECRLMSSVMSTNFNVFQPVEVGQHVLVGFANFAVSYPFVLGQVQSKDVSYNMSNAEMNIIVGTSTIKISKDRIELNAQNIIINGRSSVKLEGNSITAAGEDLKHDDIGSM